MDMVDGNQWRGEAKGTAGVEGQGSVTGRQNRKVRLKMTGFDLNDKMIQDKKG